MAAAFLKIGKVDRLGIFPRRVGLGGGQPLCGGIRRGWSGWVPRPGSPRSDGGRRQRHAGNLGQGGPSTAPCSPASSPTSARSSPCPRQQTRATAASWSAPGTTWPIAIGASIACSGVASPWSRRERTGSPSRFRESLAQDHLGDWRRGSHLNLELSLKLGDELGGTWCHSHVDGVGRIVSMTPEGGSVRFVFEAPPSWRAPSSPPKARLPWTASLTGERGRRQPLRHQHHFHQAVTTLGQAKGRPARQP